jgi:hypothetical protein
MTSTPRLQRAAATLAVVSGAGLFGLALGGVASVDGELRSATAPPVTPSRQVSDRVAATTAPDGCGWRRERRDRRPAGVQAL